MRKFEQAFVPESEQRQTFEAILKLWERGDPQMLRAFPVATKQDASALILYYVQQEAATPVYKNDVYQVMKRQRGEYWHLSIKRIDRKTIFEWRDIQEIKTELLGAEVEAVQLFPAESRLVDTANQYHLWAPVEPGYKFPFGFDEGRVQSEHSLGKSKQKPFHEKPESN